MQHFIVIGNPITHSKSPQLHQAFAEQVGLEVHYRKQFCPDNEASFFALVEAFINGGGSGANVTVPFKQMAYKLCAEDDRLTVYAKAAGAVNTLYLDNDKVCGHNTDGLGLVNHLKQLGWLKPASLNGSVKKVAVIGAGGASRGIILPLILAGIEHIDVVNRTVGKAEKLISDCQTQLDELPTQLLNDGAGHIGKMHFGSGSIDGLTGHYHLIINATSIGLSGDTLPLSEQLTCDYAYDMMYGKELPFLQHFSKQNVQTSDGYGMLIHQAILSFELWTDSQINVDKLFIEQSI